MWTKDKNKDRAITAFLLFCLIGMSGAFLRNAAMSFLENAQYAPFCEEIVKVHEPALDTDSDDYVARIDLILINATTLEPFNTAIAIHLQHPLKASVLQSQGCLQLYCKPALRKADSGKSMYDAGTCKQNLPSVINPLIWSMSFLIPVLIAFVCSLCHSFTRGFITPPPPMPVFTLVTVHQPVHQPHSLPIISVHT
jgi:hypothetical protein